MSGLVVDEITFALIVALGTTVIGLEWRSPSFLMVSGLSWIVGALFVFIDYGLEWLVLTIGMGLLVLYVGGDEQLRAGERHNERA